MSWWRRALAWVGAALAVILPVWGWWRERARRAQAEAALRRERDVADRIAEIEARAATRRVEIARRVEASAAVHDVEAARVETITDLEELARRVDAP